MWIGSYGVNVNGSIPADTSLGRHVFRSGPRHLAKKTKTGMLVPPDELGTAMSVKRLRNETIAGAARYQSIKV